METTITHARSAVGGPIVGNTYRIAGAVFLAFSIVSFLSALLFFYYGFFEGAAFSKAATLVGYASLNALFAHGFLRRERWMVAATLINFFGVVLVKAIGLANGDATVANLLVSVLVTGGIAGFTYATRASLKGKQGAYGQPLFIAYVVVLILVLLRSAGVL